MITDSPEFVRCAESWRLWDLYLELHIPGYSRERKQAFDNYVKHVRECEECKAQKGRFMEVEDEH